MIKIYSLIFFLFCGINVFCASNAFSQQEEKADLNCSHVNGVYDYYDPEEAYDFGLKIRGFVEKKDLEGLFSLVQGELRNGPRKSFIKDKEFSEIFSDQWVREFLSDTPPCGPLGWRGFVIGGGWMDGEFRGLVSSVWYDVNKEDKWTIFSIQGAVTQKTLPLPMPIWKINNRILHYHCFPVISLSGDTFEDIFDEFSISDREDFYENPGKYFGREIDRPVLHRDVDRCLDQNAYPDNQLADIKITQNGYSAKTNSLLLYWPPRPLNVYYEVIAPVTKKQCRELAPSINGTCLQSFLISISKESGGSMGYQSWYGAFGLFDIGYGNPFEGWTMRKGANLKMVPLKYFESMNTMLNWIDEQKRQQQ